MKLKRRIRETAVGLRVDAFLSEEFPLLSRRQAKSLCQENQVFLNRRPAKPGAILKKGDVIEFEEMFADVRARPELIESAQDRLSILYEDESLLVVNKPPLMASVVLRGSDAITVADHIAAICPACCEASKDPREAGLVQRLDYATSGAIIAAKSAEVWERMHQMLLSGDVSKNYLALVEGHLSGTKTWINDALVSVNGGEKMETVAEGTEDALAAKTLVEKHSSLSHQPEDISLLRVSGQGMRRHQVRAHLRSIGLPLLGDTLYGAKKTLPLAHIYREGFLLHASEIRFRHPETQNRVVISSESEEVSRLLEGAEGE